MLGSPDWWPHPSIWRHIQSKSASKRKSISPATTVPPSKRARQSHDSEHYDSAADLDTEREDIELQNRRLRECPNCDELRVYLDREEEVHAKLESTIEINSKERQSLEKEWRRQLLEKDDIVEQLQKDLAKKASQLEVAEAKLHYFATDCKQLRGKLADAGERNETLTEDLRASKATEKELGQQVKTLARDLGTQKAQNSGLVDDNASLCRKRQQDLAELAASEANFQTLTQDCEQQIREVQQENKKLLSKLESTKDQTTDLSSDLKSADCNTSLATTKRELETLRVRFKAAEAQIIRLGSNSARVLSREDAETDFIKVQEGVKIWAAEYVRPRINTVADRLKVLSQAHRSGAHLSLQGDAHGRRLDFMTASGFAKSDMDIVSTIIFDFLTRHIFTDSTVYNNGSVKKRLDLIHSLEQTMADELNTSKSLYKARSWASQAKEMVLTSSESNQIRQCFTELMVDRLLAEMGLDLFVDPPVSSKSQDARASLRETIIIPAIKLQDQMICATDMYTVELNHYRPVPYGSAPDFSLDLATLNCKNLGPAGPQRIKLEAMRKNFSADEIRKGLTKICATLPALVLRETQDGSFGPPITLVKQELLVVWKQPDDPKQSKNARQTGDRVLEEELRGFFYQLFRKFHFNRSEQGLNSGAMGSGGT